MRMRSRLDLSARCRRRPAFSCHQVKSLRRRARGYYWKASAAVRLPEKSDHAGSRRLGRHSVVARLNKPSRRGEETFCALQPIHLELDLAARQFPPGLDLTHVAAPRAADAVDDILRRWPDEFPRCRRLRVSEIPDPSYHRILTRSPRRPRKM